MKNKGKREQNRGDNSVKCLTRVKIFESVLERERFCLTNNAVWELVPVHNGEGQSEEEKGGK